MTDTIVLKFAQFDGSNFNNWRFRIEVALEEKGLLDYIQKDLAVIISGDQTNEETHKKNDKKCKPLLVQYIADSHLEYVKDKNGAKDIFDALIKVFQRKSVAIVFT